MRKPLMAGNWKMNKTIPEAIAMVKELKEKIADVKDVDVLICPAFTAISALAIETKGTNINIGAQNMFWEAKGAFTGEISPNMLVDAGCKYVIIGHSERRQYFGETNETVNKKLFIILSVPVI